MTIPVERVEADLKLAMKARDRERLDTLRLLLTELTNERIRRREAVDEATFVAVTRRAIKQRRQAAEMYRTGNREELAAKEEREAGILEEYLPAAVGEEEIREAVRALVAEQDLTGPQAIGIVMKTLLDRFGGRAEGATIHRIAREMLSS